LLQLADLLGVILKIKTLLRKHLPAQKKQLRHQIKHQKKLHQAILDEYTQKIKEAAPKLVDEYNAEYPNNQNGVEGLAELSNDKISELAEISNEGIQEMANVHLTSGSGKYEDYEDWATKLTDVYMEQAELITDAYMTSAQ